MFSPGSMGREYIGENCVRPDGFTFRSGVTTVVDAGSSGWRNFGDSGTRSSPLQDTCFRDAQHRRQRHGRAARCGAEHRRTWSRSVRPRWPKRHSDVVVGIKTAHLRRSRMDCRSIGPWRPATLANIPVMVDFGTFRPERPFQDLVLKQLRPGDIYTHTYLSPCPCSTNRASVLPYFSRPGSGGSSSMSGHGGGSFSFRQAIPAVRQGFLPDSISTDLHIDSMNAGMKDMLNVMSKFLNMGVALDQVITFTRPARQIHHEELGNLTVGAPADVAVLRLVRGNFGFVDSAGLRMKGDQKLTAEMTLRDGKVVWDLNGMSAADWNASGK